MASKRYKQYRLGRPQTLRDLRRTPGRRSPRATILIMCEDGKSAPAYFNSLRQKLNLTTVEVQVVGCGCDPNGVVERAKLIRSERKRVAEHSVSTSEYDEVWCVFDRETPGDRPEFDSAIQHANEARLRLAPSNPCFEYWILLHFEQTTAPFHNCFELLKRLKKHHIPNYSKGMNCFGHIEEHTKTAIKNAETAVKINASEAYPNPCTHIHLLVKSMLKVAEN
jgi:hypothetical protein